MLTLYLSGDLTNDEKDDYVKAVKCLLAAPSKLSSTQYPGAKSRYDDFVVVHINMTMGVHDTVSPSLFRADASTDHWRQTSSTGIDITSGLTKSH